MSCEAIKSFFKLMATSYQDVGSVNGVISLLSAVDGALRSLHTSLTHTHTHRSFSVEAVHWQRGRNSTSGNFDWFTLCWVEEKKIWCRWRLRRRPRSSWFTFSCRLHPLVQVATWERITYQVVNPIWRGSKFVPARPLSRRNHLTHHLIIKKTAQTYR